MHRWLLPGVLLAMTSGCPGFGDKSLAELEGVSGALTWEADIKPMFETYCWQCHDVGGTGPNVYTEYAQVVGNYTSIRDRVVVRKDMPEGFGMPDAERAKFDLWLTQGAPEGTVEATPDAGMSDELMPTFDSLNAQILSKKCAVLGCHVGSNPSQGLDLSTYAGFNTGGFSGDLTGGGDPEASLLIDHLRGRNGLTFMPSERGQLPEDQIQVFETWIANGHPEN